VALVTIRQGLVAQQRIEARIEQRKIVRYRGMMAVMSVANEIWLAEMLTPIVATQKTKAEKNWAAREPNSLQRDAGS